jgi:hypothetical protein
MVMAKMVLLIGVGARVTKFARPTSTAIEIYHMMDNDVVYDDLLHHHDDAENQHAYEQCLVANISRLISPP